jgi:hypothetical protein
VALRIRGEQVYNHCFLRAGHMKGDSNNACSCIYILHSIMEKTAFKITVTTLSFLGGISQVIYPDTEVSLHFSVFRALKYICGVEGRWDTSVSSQFCCEPKTAPKKKKKEAFQDDFLKAMKMTY